MSIVTSVLEFCAMHPMTIRIYSRLKCADVQLVNDSG